MQEKIIDISENGGKISVMNGLLKIDSGGDKAEVPLDEIGALVISNPAVTITHGAIAELAAAGAVTVVCDRRHLPAGIVQPYIEHHLQTERFAAQVNAALPVKKRIWRQIVRCKIRQQGRLLKNITGGSCGLDLLEDQVHSGDPDNVEARAAVIYWREIFGAGSGFRRRREGEDQNRFLNYGYTVLRAVIARAVCGAGLHPSIGISHHNRYNPFCLADDLMEPFRPMVDNAVHQVSARFGPQSQFSREIRYKLINPIMGRVQVGDENMTVFHAAAAMASSLVEQFMSGGQPFILPENVLPQGVPFDDIGNESENQ